MVSLRAAAVELQGAIGVAYGLFEPAQLAVDDGAVHEGTDVGSVGVYHLDTQTRTIVHAQSRG
jgi:hypothetical protein